MSSGNIRYKYYSNSRMPCAMFVHRCTSPFVKATAACHVTYHVTQQPVPTKTVKTILSCDQAVWPSKQKLSKQ